MSNFQKVFISLAPMLRSDFLSYLDKNKKDIGEFLTIEAKKKIGPQSPYSELVAKSIQDTISSVIDALPLIMDLTEESLKEPVLVQKIIEQLDDLMNSPQVDDLINPSTIDYPKKISKMIGLLKELGEANHKIRENFLQKLLPLLSEKFTPLVEELLKEIKGGKINVQEIIEILGGNAELREAITKVVHEYPKYTFRKDILPIIGLILTDMKALKLVIEACANLISYNIDKYLVPNIVRDKFYSSNINTMIEHISKNLRTEKDENGTYDFTKELQEFNKTTDKLLSSTLDYSLNNKDFQGMSINSSLDHFKMQGFNFDGCKFVNFSCEGAEFINCSFKNVSFTKNTSFKNITIDEATLLTLSLAIKQHNQDHPKYLLALYPIDSRNNKTQCNILPVSISHNIVEGQGQKGKTQTYLERVRASRTRSGDLGTKKLP